VTEDTFLPIEDLLSTEEVCSNCFLVKPVADGPCGNCADTDGTAFSMVNQTLKLGYNR